MAVQAQSTPAMQVPLLDLKPQYRTMAGEIQAAMEKVCESQQFILGPAVKELEASVAAYSQCRHGIGVSSGTDALLLALMALDRKSTRLNSSHSQISYAVFCLKKKKP